MAQHDYVIDNSTGANVRADINNALLAISSNNSGSSAPSTTYALQSFANTTDSMLQLRNAANNAFVNLRKFDGSCPLPDGTNSAPSLFFDDDTNTGVYSSAADTLNIATGGTERMELGTTTIFNEDGADVDFRIEGDTNANLFYVNAGDDRIGIGTATPTDLLHCVSSGFSLAKFESTSAGDTGPTMILYHNSASPADNDFVGALYFHGNHSGGTDSVHNYSYIAAQSLDVTDGTEDSNLIFATSVAGATAERMRIDELGNVGIGLTNASVRLHASDTGSGLKTISWLNNAQAVATDGGAALAFTGTSSNNGLARISGHFQGSATTDGGYMRIDTRAPSSGTLTERVRIDKDGHVGIGTSTPDQLSAGSDSTILAVIESSGTRRGQLLLGDNQNVDTGGIGDIHFVGKYQNSGHIDMACIKAQAKGSTSGQRGAAIIFETKEDAATIQEGMRLTDEGRLGVGTSTPDHIISAVAANSSNPRIGITNPSNDENFNISTYHDGNGIYAILGCNVKYLSNGNLTTDTTAHKTAAVEVDARNNGAIFFLTGNSGGNPESRMKISQDGNVFVNNTGDLDAYRLAGAGSSVRGHLIRADGNSASTVSQQQFITGNRLDSDGPLITFSQDGSQEGNISVSGSTVSYNGGHLSRWSQLSGISSTDKSARPTIYQGTVMSNLDELCEWSHADVVYKEDVLYTNKDTIPEGKSEGDVKHAKGSVLRAAYTEENQQLNMTKISDTEGDKDVAGVFWTWDDEDDEIVNDFYIAMTGDMVIRVAASTTVARGDLLISAGDGTAKPQADDIIRSSTIAKIISTNHTATYADGSKAYPCVLMAC